MHFSVLRDTVALTSLVNFKVARWPKVETIKARQSLEAIASNDEEHWLGNGFAGKKAKEAAQQRLASNSYLEAHDSMCLKARLTLRPLGDMLALWPSPTLCIRQGTWMAPAVHARSSRPRRPRHFWEWSVQLGRYVCTMQVQDYSQA